MRGQALCRPSGALKGRPAFVKLQEDALANPRPGLLFKLWRESHPPLGERIDFTNEYHPWRDGRPLAYGDRFKR